MRERVTHNLARRRPPYNAVVDEANNLAFEFRRNGRELPTDAFLSCPLARKLDRTKELALHMPRWLIFCEGRTYNERAVDIPVFHKRI